MNLSRTIIIILIVAFAISALFSAIYISRNRNQLVFNPVVKAALPMYRGIRDLGNGIIDFAYVFKMRRNVGIPQYRLEIKSSDLRELNSALPSSLNNDVIAGKVLFNENFKDTVSGAFYYDNKKYDVNVRYRGLNANHWTRAKKSWQIKFDKDTPFNSISTLKLIIPADRGYFVEMLNNYRAQKLGLFFPRAELAQLYVNNDYHGVYFAVEDFSGDSRIYVVNEPIEGGNAFVSADFWRCEAQCSESGLEDFTELNFLLKQMQEDDFLDKIEDIIDLENFYKWNITSVLAGSDHQSNSGNLRIYFDNETAKFGFIPWDVGISNNIPLTFNNDLTDKILSVPKFYEQRNKALLEYIKEEGNLKDDLDYYDSLYNKTKGTFYSDFRKHDNNITFNKKVAQFRGQYEILFKQAQDLFSID